MNWTGHVLRQLGVAVRDLPDGTPGVLTTDLENLMKPWTHEMSRIFLAHYDSTTTPEMPGVVDARAVEHALSVLRSRGLL